MDNHGAYPFVRLIIPYLAGIALSLSMGWGFALPYRMITGLFIFMILFLAVFPPFIGYRGRWLPGSLVYMLLIISGFLWTNRQIKIDQPGHFRNAGDFEFFAGRVIEPVAEKERTFKVLLDAGYACDSSRGKVVSGRLLCYFEKDSAAAVIAYGDFLVVRADPVPARPSLNPGEFDYRRHLFFREIYDQAYVPAGSWKVLSKGHGNPVYEKAFQLRDNFLMVLKEKGIDGEVYQVAAAILVGYDEMLSPELRNRYAHAGAMHILCVSGLHVGVIYLILSMLLKFLKRRRVLNIVRVIILLVSIWIYAMITGLAPSVMRASTMISFVIIGTAMKRSAPIYNTLAASAFFLLLTDPMMLMSVGFQLSYLAVISIVSIQPVIYRIFYTKFMLIDKLWAIISVSLAAQLGTFPLAVYYFNLFPNYFLLTNIIVIPLSSLIIYSGFFLALTSPFGFTGNLFAFALKYLLVVMNYSIRLIDQLPGSLSDGLYLTSAEMVVLYMIIISFALMFLLKRRRWLICSMVFISLLFVLINNRYYHQKKQEVFIVYAVKGSRAYDFVKGDRHFFVADSALLTDQTKISYHIAGYWIKKGLKKNEKWGSPAITDINKMPNVECRMYNGFTFFNGKRILFLDELRESLLIGGKISVDIVVVSGGFQGKVEKIAQIFNPELLVFDSSCKTWDTERWKEEAQELGTTCHDVMTDGAFILENAKCKMQNGKWKMKSGHFFIFLNLLM